MNQTIQLLSIIVMFFLSYVGLRAFGRPNTKLLFNKEEKRHWHTLLQSSFGNWLVGTNIVGTLTSFATVLVFFLGNAKLFGLWILTCSFSIWIGGYVSNFFTQKISALPRVKTLLSSSSQTGGVMASLCWTDSVEGKKSSLLIKYISLLNILAVIWLEFALFADIGGEILGFNNIGSKVFIIAATSFAVIFFVLRYGIRGFAFVDIFQTPVIALSALLIVVGSLWLLYESTINVSYDFFQPIVETRTIILFVIHVIFLNSFLVLATEPHWLRLWMFQNKETEIQIVSTLSTAILWAVLAGIGFIASALFQGNIGPSIIASLINKLSDLSPVFLVAFWFAAVCALFTTADAQIYSWLIVKNFNPESGTLQESKLEAASSFTYSIGGCLAFSLSYFLFRNFSIPIDKLVFLIIPFSLNTMPAIVQLAYKRQPTPILTIISVFCFIGLGIGGFIQPDNELFWTLSAALAPLVVSVFAPFIGKKLEN